MATKLVIANGLRLDFTLAAAGGSDNFLGVDATGSPTYFASIPVTRIAAQTPNRAATFNGSGFLAPSATTATELGFVAGATSSIQTQLNNKQPLIVLAFNRAVVSDGAGALAVSATTATEISYSSGVTSAIQTQLNAKQATITGGASTIVTSNLTVNRALMSDGSGKVAVSTVTATELGYSSGVTSAIQSQINAKLTVTVTAPASGDVITYNGSSWVNSASAAQGVPVGGTAGQYLNKINSTNYNTQWSTLIAAKITDVTSTAAELNLLHGVTTSTVQFNYLNTVTSDVQSQINARLINNLALNAIWIGNASNVATQLSAGTSGYVLTSVSGVPTWQPSAGGGGGIAGPGTSTLNAAVRWSNTLGTVVKDSVVVITDAGLMTGGTWNGNLVTGQYGGTGVVNTGKTITLGGNFTLSGAFATTFTVTNTTNVTLPTSGTLSTFTNTAANTELIMSNGTNGVPSGIYSVVAGNLDLGVGLAGTIRNVNAAGSGANVDLQFNAKGSGTLTLVGNAVIIGATTYGIAIGDITIQGNQSSVANTAGGNIKIYSGQGNSGNASSGNIFIDTLAKSGSGIVGSVSFFKTTADYGAGEKVIFIGNATTNPSTNPTGGGIMFVKPSDNKPYWRTPAGVETVMLAGGAGITNTALNNEIPKSDGTNIGPSGIFSTSSGNITTGVWQATPVGLAFGGTNTNLSASAAIGDLIQASSGTAFSRLAAVAIGSYLRSAGTGTLLVWSTTTIPNTVVVGDLWQATATNAVSTLASVATGNVLLSGGVATVSAWGKVGLTTHVTGVLPLANGGTASNLVDPGADKIMAWDDTDNSVGFWGLGVGLSYDHVTHTLTSTGGGGGGTPGGSNTQVQFNNSGIFGGNANFTINNGTGVVTFGQIPVFTLGLGSATATTQPAATNNTTLATTAYVDNITLPAFTTTLDGFTLASGGAGRLLLGDNTWLATSTNGFVLTLVAGVPAWAAGMTNPMTSVGDLIQGTTAGAPARLASVAAGSFLRSGGVTTASAWSTTVWTNSATIGDILQATSSNTYTNLAAVATGNALLSGGVATANAWGKVGLTTHVSGVLPLANGGTASNMSDPGAHSIMGWDDTINAVRFFVIGSGLTYTQATNTLSAAGGGGGGITNTAAANELMKSDGVNAVPSGFFATTNGSLIMGTSLSGASRSITMAGSAADVGLDIFMKGAGQIGLGGTTFTLGTSAQTGLSTRTIIPAGSAADISIFITTKGLANIDIAGWNIGLGGTQYAGSVGDIDLIGNYSSTSGIKGGSLFFISGIGNTTNADSGNIYLDVGTIVGGTGKYGNISLFEHTGSNYGGGQKIVYMASAVAAPTTSITGGAGFYVDPVTQHPMWVIGTQIFDLMEPISVIAAMQARGNTV